jgi:Response regulator containing CheY-like receiver domain and AraC-type DNA-binding domain
MIDLLIVDDEERIREGIRNGLEWEKYGVNIIGTPGSAFEAMDYIMKSPPHLVILDIRMSEMDGLEFLEILHDKFPNIKVILISGYNDFQYAQKAISLNAFCYLLKPLDSEELLSKVLDVKKIVEDQLEKVKKDEEFQRKFLENIPILYDNFLTQLALGKLNDIKVIYEKADFLKLDMTSPEYIFIVVSIDSSTGSSNGDIYSHNLFKSAIMSTSEVYFKTRYRCYSFNLDDSIGLLICGKNLDHGFIYTACHNLKEWVNKDLGLTITIGIGGIHEGLGEIALSCREALDALSYKLVLGKNEIIDIRQIPENEKTKLAESMFEMLLKEKEDSLLFSIKTNELNNAKAIWYEIIAALKKSMEADIRQTDSLLYLVSYFITRLVFTLDMGLDKFLDDDKSIYKSLNNMKTIDEVMAYGISFFEKAASIYRERQNKTTHYLVNQAMDYINNNIYEDISLTAVANSLYVHPNYLSKVFKLQLEVSFVEYVTNAKMNEAKKLLKNGNYKIYTIADILKYKDINYFTKLFKKTFGVSPTEYRELV